MNPRAPDVRVKASVVLRRVVTTSDRAFASFFPLNVVCRCNHYTVVIVQRNEVVSEVTSVEPVFRSSPRSDNRFSRNVRP